MPIPKDEFRAVSDVDRAVAAARLHAQATADEIDGGFGEEDVTAWMETAVEPIDDRADATAAGAEHE